MERPGASALPRPDPHPDAPLRSRSLSIPKRRSGERRNAHRAAEAPAALEEIAVLAVHRRVLHAGEQQAVAVEATVLAVVLEQALGDFLVVRVIAEPARR